MAKKKQAPVDRNVDPELVRAFRAYKKHAPHLRKRIGVLAVGFGLKSTNGCYGFESLPHLPAPKNPKVTYAIRVYVAHKLAKGSLSKREMIPAEYEGVPTDVIEVKPGRSVGTVDSTTDFPTLIGGAPIGFGNLGGTLGIVLTGPDGQQRIVTCGHVAFGGGIFGHNAGGVFQPPNGTDVGIPEINGLNAQVRQDCASVVLNGAKPAVSNQIQTLGAVAGTVAHTEATVNTIVMKFGMKTERTTGRIVGAFSFFPSGSLGVSFTNQYTIASTVASLPFSDEGDSGALVVARRNGGLAAVGILIGLSSAGESIALPIDDALDILGLQI
jgi:hypothetical protein